MSDKKFDIRTPGSKHKAESTGSSRAVADVALHTPNKRSKTDITVRNIEDEEFPEGYTLLETITTPAKSVAWKMNDEKVQRDDDDLEFVPTSDGNTEFPIVGQYDDLMQAIYDLLNENLTEEFLEFAINQEECRLEWLKSVQECKRLQMELENANSTISSYANNLALARKLLDKEKQLRKRAERERDALEEQMLTARDLLFSDKCRNKLPEDTREKLAFLNNTSLKSQTLDRNGGGQPGGRLNTISEVSSQEINSTGSLLSDFSCTRSEDDLDLSAFRAGKRFKDHEPGPPEQVSPQKKRRSTNNKVIEINPSDKIVATTTVSVSRDGPITATSVIETVPQEEEEEQEVVLVVDAGQRADVGDTSKAATPASIVEQLWLRDKSPAVTMGRCSIKRQHNFVTKAIIRPDVCGPCNKRIRFGKIALRCKDCKGACHTECKDRLPLPCVPQVNTPTHKGVIGCIADYVPRMSPMVPALIVHCLNEVEARGLQEVGLYRVPGSEKEVRSLKERFMRGKGAPLLDDVDVHVLCGVVKDFLRSLQEPLVTHALWHDFIRAADASDPVDIAPSLYQAISQLPQPNKDTLAYMLLHLQKVAVSKECKMPVGNLSKVFGPTIVGYSSQEPDPQQMLQETRQQAMVMECLLNLPTEFWATIANFDSRTTTPRSRRVAESPSTESLHKGGGGGGGFFTPYGIRSAQKIRKERKFFGTPPTK